jgi:T5SS/PEP-CTERM-associated repeat protein
MRLESVWSNSTTCNRMKTGLSFFAGWLGSRSRVATLPIALLLFSSARLACAQTIWIDGAGDWFESANWSAGVPITSSEAEISNSGTAQINLNGAIAERLILGAGNVNSGNLVVTGSGSTLSNETLLVGQAGSGTVIVQNGGFLSHVFGNIGDLPGSNGEVLVEGTGSRWTTNLYFNVGYSGSGMLTIRNGGTVASRFGWVGHNPGSTGVVLVDGVGSVWSSVAGIEIGSSGTGSLTIQNGGTVSGLDLIGNYFGHGEVLVDGPGSTLTSGDRIIVGYSAGGSGTLTIQNAATVSDGEGFIGWPDGSMGTVLVDGAGSTWNNPQGLTIDKFGAGSLTIQNAGAVFSGFGTNGGTVVVDGLGSTWSIIDDLAVTGTLTIRNRGTVTSDGSSIAIGGTVLIDGVGSTWTNDDPSYVGGVGPGNLAIRNGGRLSSAGGYLGWDYTGNGVVLVDGAGSTWNNDNGEYFRVGFFGFGTLTISNGGLVTSLRADVGVDVVSTGNVTVDGVGSEWNVGTILYVGGGDRGDGGRPGGTGLLQIVNAGKISSPSTTVFRLGAIINNALLVSQNVSITGGLLGGVGIVLGNVTNAGNIKPGDSIGSLTISGNYIQLSDGTLTLEVVGIAPDVSDHLDITGNATIDGTLEVRFVNGFLPVSGQVFKLIDVGGTFNGSFAQFIFPNLRPGFQFLAEFVKGSYQITALNDGVAATGFLNTSTRLRVGTGDNALIGGFVVTGSAPKRVIIRAIGPSLAPLLGRLADPTLELRDGTGGLIFSNDNWMDSPQAQQIIDSGIPPSDDHEAAIIATLAPGSYTAVMRGANRTTGIGVLEVYDPAQEASAKLANISSRGFVELSDNVMIGGFIVDNQAAHVLVRAIGPSLTQFGVANALADPTLEFYNSDGVIIAFNNDWQDSLDPAAIEATGIPPTDEKESAILATLAPGNYTAIVRGLNDTTGVGLVEVYHLQ